MSGAASTFHEIAGCAGITDATTMYLVSAVVGLTAFVALSSIRAIIAEYTKRIVFRGERRGKLERAEAFLDQARVELGRREAEIQGLRMAAGSMAAEIDRLHLRHDAAQEEIDRLRALIRKIGDLVAIHPSDRPQKRITRESVQHTQLWLDPSRIEIASDRSVTCEPSLNAAKARSPASSVRPLPAP